MGIKVNLLDAWMPYKAAITALNNTLEPANVKRLVRYNSASFLSLTAMIATWQHGKLFRDNVLLPATMMLH